jgi:hypothetical protein
MKLMGGSLRLLRVGENPFFLCRYSPGVEVDHLIKKYFKTVV